jgi:hypothetical protein
MQMDFTKRMANHWQLSATYLLQFNYEYQYAPINRDKGCKYPITNPSPGVFTCDSGDDAAPAARSTERFLNGDQRNRATVNGILGTARGFQLSGLYSLRITAR